METPRVESLAALIGAKLRSLSRGDFLIDGLLNQDDLGPLELVFETGGSLQLWLASDGESIEYQFATTAMDHLPGQGGPWPKVPLSNNAGYSTFCGQELRSIQAIWFGSDPIERCTLAGVVFRFQGGDFLAYYNAGDSAKIYVNELPPALPVPFFIRFADVRTCT